MSTHLQSSRNGEIFTITARPSSLERRVPEGRALMLTSDDRAGYRSAHRSLAKALGWTRKERECVTGAGLVSTYWLPPVGTPTSELPEV